jgi:hypothetical protein
MSRYSWRSSVRTLVRPVRRLAYLQKIEEVSRQHQLDRSILIPGQILEEGLKLRWRFEPITAGIPTNVRIGDKHN